jgi:hypothetical protein
VLVFHLFGATPHHKKDPQTDMEIRTEIRFSSWWGKCSALVAPDCFLARFKKAVNEELLATGILSPIDLVDPRNHLAHVALTTKEFPQHQPTYDRYNGKNVTLTAANVCLGSNLLEIDLSKNNPTIGPDLHMSVMYKRGLGQHKEQVFRTVQTVWASLVGGALPAVVGVPVPEEKTDLKTEGSAESKSQGRLDCSVCLSVPHDCVLLPCGHVCICTICAARLSLCPVCRGAIGQRAKVFL